MSSSKLVDSILLPAKPLDLVWTSTRDFGSGEIYVKLGTGAPVRLTNNISVDENASIR